MTATTTSETSIELMSDTTTEAYDHELEVREFLADKLKAITTFMQRHETSVFISVCFQNTVDQEDGDGGTYGSAHIAAAANSYVLPDLVFALIASAKENPKAGLAVALRQHQEPEDKGLHVFDIRDEVAKEGIDALFTTISEKLTAMNLPFILMLTTSIDAEGNATYLKHFHNPGPNRTPAVVQLELAGAEHGIKGMVDYGDRVAPRFMDAMRNNTMFHKLAYEGMA